MAKFTILIAGIVSFIVGAMIFLTGIGAIVGVAGGIVAFLIGSVVSIVGIGSIIDYMLTHNKQLQPAKCEVIELNQQDGRWV